MTQRRFIEEYFPVKNVGLESTREKSQRHGHISTLHMWWARRPLGASRATIYASLIPTPGEADEVEQIKNEISSMSRWENPISNKVISVAKKRIAGYWKERPKVLDPFSGGGSIPLEALRLGCDVYATDYNPVSNLIVSAVTKYPFLDNANKGSALKSHAGQSLIQDIKKWSTHIMDEAKKDLMKFFPNEDGGEPVGYLWSRCIPCQNPECGANIPLLKQFWIANTKNKKIALVHQKTAFRLLHAESFPKDFDPSMGTIDRGKATCMQCKNRIDGKSVKALFAGNHNSETMNVVVVKSKKKSGKIYKVAKKQHADVFNKARTELVKKRHQFIKKFGVDPIPDEPTPEGRGGGAERAFSIRLYDLNTWGDLFNDRQKLVLVTFMEKILSVAETLKGDDGMRVLAYLCIIFDRLVDKNSTLSTWHVGGEKMESAFRRQALPMIWDYAEINPFTNIGWPNMESWVVQVLEHLGSIDGSPATVKHTSATSLPFKNEFFDAVITDPPYYDNVPYSHLSDFFYVWLKRLLGQRLPHLFSTPLTPKRNEIVVYSDGTHGREDGKEHFQQALGDAFSEIHRVLKPDGISIIVYAHKSTEGWETLIESLLRSKLVVTAAWPIHTEMKSRLRSKESAALLSSIYMVCRKWKREPEGIYSAVKSELKAYLEKKLEQLWDEGITGADFLISAIGSAVEVYGKYDVILDDGGNLVSTRRLLEDTRAIVINYAIDTVMHGKFSDKVSRLTRFYVLWRHLHGESKVPYDDALKLAQGTGISLKHEIGRGFIKRDGHHVRVIGPDERNDEDLTESGELIDVLHHALRMWKRQKAGDVDAFLSKKGYGHSEMLRIVARAVSASLSDIRGSKEKDWIDGMFTGVLGDSSSDKSQTKLFKPE